MAARALTAAARLRAGTGAGPPLLSCTRSGGAKTHSTTSAQQQQQPEEEPAMAAATGARVEAALNRKDVEVLDLDLKGEEEQPEVPVTIVGGGGTLGAGGWVPDRETGVFVPADAGTDAATPAPPVNGGSTASVLDQAVFVREEDMEDVERPAIDMPNANSKANANGSSSN